jgi:hypothetical protein
VRPLGRVRACAVSCPPLAPTRNPQQGTRPPAAAVHPLAASRCRQPSPGVLGSRPLPPSGSRPGPTMWARVQLCRRPVSPPTGLLAVSGVDSGAAGLVRLLRGLASPPVLSSTPCVLPDAGDGALALLPSSGAAAVAAKRSRKRVASPPAAAAATADGPAAADGTGAVDPGAPGGAAEGTCYLRDWVCSCDFAPVVSPPPHRSLPAVHLAPPIPCPHLHLCATVAAPALVVTKPRKKRVVLAPTTGSLPGNAAGGADGVAAGTAAPDSIEDAAKGEMDVGTYGLHVVPSPCSSPYWSSRCS